MVSLFNKNSNKVVVKYSFSKLCCTAKFCYSEYLLWWIRQMHMRGFYLGSPHQNNYTILWVICFTFQEHWRVSSVPKFKVQEYKAPWQCVFLFPFFMNKRGKIDPEAILENTFDWCCYSPCLPLSLITQSELLTSIILEGLMPLYCDWLDITSGWCNTPRTG